jgi:hypothetical protein
MTNQPNRKVDDVTPEDEDAVETGRDVLAAFNAEGVLDDPGVPTDEPQSPADEADAPAPPG